MMMDPISLNCSDTNSESIPKSLRNRSVRTFLIIIAILSLCGYHHQHEHARLRSTEVDLLRSTEVDFGVKSSSIMLSAASSGSAAATALVAVATGKGSLDMLVVALKPVLLELGVVVILQSVGVPMVSTLGLLARRVRWASIGRGIGVSATAVKNFKLSAKVGGQVWKQLAGTYTKTSASKIVGRSKNIIKQMIKQQIYHHEDDHEEAVKAH
jgi:hypothetical protein